MEFIDETFKEKIEIFEKEFISCIFDSMDFSYESFDFAIFEDCVFKNCNLSLVTLKDTAFKSCQFIDCKVTGVHFTSTHPLFRDFSFEKCRIEFSTFTHLDLKKISFKESLIYESDFYSCNLIKGDFSYTDLKNSCFDESNLEEANFEGAINYDINPLNTNIKKAIFSGIEATRLLNVFQIKLV